MAHHSPDTYIDYIYICQWVLSAASIVFILANKAGLCHHVTSEENSEAEQKYILTVNPAIENIVKRQKKSQTWEWECYLTCYLTCLFWKLVLWILLKVFEGLLRFYMLQGLLDKFGTVLHAESAGTILTAATNWEDLEIQEEAESGSSVLSKIRLPVQVRWTSEHRQQEQRLNSILWFNAKLFFFWSSAANMVCAVAAVPAVCGDQQGGRPCPAAAHPARASADLSDSGPAPLPQPHTRGPRQGNSPPVSLSQL